MHTSLQESVATKEAVNAILNFAKFDAVADFALQVVDQPAERRKLLSARAFGAMVKTLLVCSGRRISILQGSLL